MFSMAAATLFLPFLPMLPLQILHNNFLYDLSELPIPLDNVDEQDLARPRRWDMAFIRDFMVCIGPISSIFDFLTFWLLLKVCLGYALVLWACNQLFPGAFARIFTPEPELVAFTAGMLRIYCGALFLMGIQIACQMTFVSIGNAPCSIVVAVLRKFVLLLPLIYLLPHLLADQTRAVFLAEPVADTIAVTGTVLLFSFQFRKALRRLEGDNKS